MELPFLLFLVLACLLGGVRRLSALRRETANARRSGSGRWKGQRARRVRPRSTGGTIKEHDLVVQIKGIRHGREAVRINCANVTMEGTTTC